jgi:ribosomal protein L11 methyltransferase
MAVRVSVPDAEADLAADALWQAGAAAIEERPGVLVAGTDDGGDPAALLAAVAGRWPAEVVVVDLDTALDAWRPHARAVEVGRRLVVRPPWVAPPDASPGRRVDVVIDPGRSFGHGGHPSTRLVLAALDDLVHGGEQVLDRGCGSGVLAIAALALGASSAMAVDIDPAAVAATLDNAARNGVADRLVAVDDLATLAGSGAGDGDDDVDRATLVGDVDLAVANVLLPEHAVVAPAVARALAPGALVVVSGVLTSQRDEAAACYADEGLVPLGPARVDDGWLALTLGAG